MTARRIIAFNKNFEKQILKWQQFDILPVDNSIKVKGLEEYNHLVDLNLTLDASWFMCALIDRSKFISSPYNFKIQRPWRPPASSITLEKFFEKRVQDYCKHNTNINLFWSGGIDSTAVIVAFLIHCKNLNQVRIIYTHESCYEHPKFFKLLTQQFPQIEKIQLDFYNCVSTTLDGLAVTGNPADELLGCLSPSASDCHDASALIQPWKDFVNKISGDDLVQFVEQWVGVAKQPIITVMDLRWWNYMQVHVQGCMTNINVSLKSICPDHNWDVGFYDCYEFEDYVYYNTKQLADFNTYKDFLKSYIYNFDYDLEFYNLSKNL